MTKHALLLAALVALAGCDGNGPNPVNGGIPGVPDAPGVPTPGEVLIPEELAINVTGVGFAANDPNNPLDDVLTVEGIGADDAPFTAVYNRNASLDVEGYSAFSSQ